MSDNRTTELLQELRDLAADVNTSEIIDHVSITRMGWTFDAQWLDAWHMEFDRIMQDIAATLGNHPTKSGRGYYTDRDGDGTHIMCDDCGGYIGTAEEIAATLGSEREKELELLVKQLWHLVNHRSGYGYAAALEAIEELGIEVDE